MALDPPEDEPHEPHPSSTSDDLSHANAPTGDEDAPLPGSRKNQPSRRPPESISALWLQKGSHVAKLAECQYVMEVLGDLRSGSPISG